MQTRKVILIYGPNGAGKTFLANSVLPRFPRRFITDAGFREFTALYFDGLEGCLSHLEALRAFPEKGRGPFTPFCVGWNPVKPDYPLTFEIAMQLRNCLLVLEEADRFGDGREGPCCDEYDQLITQGRHYEVSFLAIGLHPVELPKDLRRQATEVFSFGMTDPEDIAALQKIVGPKIRELPPPPPAEILPPPHPYLHWVRGVGAQIHTPPGYKLPPGPERESAESVSTKGAAAKKGPLPGSPQPQPPEAEKSTAEKNQNAP